MNEETKKFLEWSEESMASAAERLRKGIDKKDWKQVGDSLTHLEEALGYLRDTNREIRLEAR